MYRMKKIWYKTDNNRSGYKRCRINYRLHLNLWMPAILIRINILIRLKNEGSYHPKKFIHVCTYISYILG